MQTKPTSTAIGIYANFLDFLKAKTRDMAIRNMKSGMR